MSSKTKEVKPPKTLMKSMLETRVNPNKKFPKNVKKAIKKLVRSSSTQPGNTAFPNPMPTSIRMNKENRGKIKRSLGKSVKTGRDKVIKKAHGGSMCRGMGAATKGGQFRKNG